MHPLILTILGQAGIAGAGSRDLMRSKPVQRNATASAVEMTKAGKARRRKLGATEDLPIKINTNKPRDLEEIFAKDDFNAFKEDYLSGTEKYASIQPFVDVSGQAKPNPMTAPRAGFQININPNIDEAFYAHELGHYASTGSRFGDVISRLRTQPNLMKAVGIGGALTALGAGALTPGDEDLDEAILGSLALASPTLIDEALASKNALAIMEDAGRRATLGQKGRLAGAYLTYLAAPASTAILANTIGNQFDEDV